ncbi:MAG: metallophosphoesterase [Candidatus Nezhaarchaeales archaeon]
MIKIKSKRGLLVIIGVILICLIVYALLIEPNLIVTGTVLTLKFSDLPDAFNGFKIAHIADTHFGMWHLPIRDDIAIQIIDDFKPDIIVFTGDIICNVNGITDALKFIAHLTSIAPTIIVFGNWDYWSEANITELVNQLKELGAIVLINNSTIITRGKDEIYVAGVDDPYTWRHDLTRALSGIPINAFKILLAHSPQIIREARGKVDLILAGHTHGGQVNIPLLGPLFVPLPPGSRKYVAGIFTENGTVMYVNRGLGCSMLPIRFMCPPEVALITLVKD